MTHSYPIRASSQNIEAGGSSLPVQAGQEKKRSPALPDVPTLAESGLPNYEAVAWYGLMAPKGTPKDILEKLGAAIQKMKTPETEKRLEQLGTEPVLSTPAEMATAIESDVDSYRDLIQKTGIQIE